MNKKRAFLGAPFAGYLDPVTGVVAGNKRVMIEQLIECLQTKDYEVRNAHVREDWGGRWMAPEVCTPLDYEEIATADLFVALLGSPGSGGVHVELGWATALGTRVVMLLEEEGRYSSLIYGLGEVGNVRYVRYRTTAECLQGLEAAL